MRSLLILLFCLPSYFTFAQVAPNFTLTDVNGETHELYEYLDAGKTVVLDFYAVWCGPCQTNAAGVEDVYLDLGPDGANDVMILGIEGDDDSTDEEVNQYAIDYDCSNPQINNSEDVMDLYDISYYPTYLVVCPDRSFEEYEGISPEEIEVELTLGIELCEAFEGEAVDARLFGYNSGSTLCSDETTPNITLMNMGSEPLTSVDIKTFLNGDLQSTTNWTGNLNLYDFEFITLPLIDLSGISDPMINVVLENPNGVVDPNPDNNEATVNIEYGGSNFETDYVRLELYFDNFPQETDWEILNSVGEIIVSGGDYVGFPDFSPPIDSLLYLPTGDCYTFNIYDQFGDGICCAFADPDEGFWKISTANGTLIAEGGVFTDQETAIFGIAEPLGVSALDQENILVFPNPAKNTIQVNSPSIPLLRYEILDLMGSVIDSQSFTGNAINIQKFPNGNYVLRLYSDAHVINKKISIIH